MPGKPAARVTDNVSHPVPPLLGPGPGSPNVFTGSLPAWRGVPSATAGALQAAKQVSDAVIKAAEAATAAAAGTPGAPAAKAAEEATMEVAPAVIASICTNIVVFLPIVFMAGLMGQFFKEFGLVQIFATIIAFCVGFTLIPMLSSKFLHVTRETWLSRQWEKGFLLLKAKYKDFLPIVFLNLLGL